ncbi:tyrosine-type recombinase/integrase [Gracilibacillus sp. YIM 98692]|uniref:tyrosine-type recombinase/integrase n=1 Tax=Gracilibacillus sp. YIM 98692 TaxID=2663532 RepID=UPI0013D3287C|nr:tyrosine-type recombinase/integrase [Gracilibacillus sp. YIM 98692]
MYKNKVSKKDPLIKSYLNGKGKELWNFRYKYYDSLDNRKEVRRQGFRTENEAYRALLEIKTSIANGDIKKVEKSKLTISEWLDIWYETHKSDWKVTTLRQREMAIRNVFNPLLGKYKLQELDKTTYKRVFINTLLKKYKPSTVKLFHRIFKVAINSAVDNEILNRNRFNKITIQDIEETVDKIDGNFLTAEELNILLETTKKYENITNYTLVLLLAYTGVRRGEACGLKWKNIDFENKSLTIELTRDNKGARPPKTKNSYRTILIDDILLNQLANYQKWCKETLLCFGKHLKQDNFMFLSYQTGKPITDSVILYCLRRVLKKSGIKRITPHGLRHTHATILLNENVGIKYIAERLGNTPAMIMDIYGHTIKENEEKTVSTFTDKMKSAGAKNGAPF